MGEDGPSRAQSRTITLTWQLLSRLTATTRRVRCAGLPNEALREERQDIVACLDRRLAGRVDQVGRHNAVRARNALRDEGRHVGVCRAVGEHAPDETVAE